MTKYHKEQALKRYLIDGFNCQKCGKLLNQIGSGLAHRIPKTKYNLKKYGEKIVNHNINLVPSCVKCNQSFLINNNENKKNILIEMIKNNLNLLSDEIDKIIQQNEIQ